MLFALTGKIQTGKTRWLERLVDRLETQGSRCAGVIAPGVWRRHVVPDAVFSSGDGGGDSCGDSGGAGEVERFEKLGIDNVLLPDGTRISFARRADLAYAEGTFNENSQSARAGLDWAIDDGAIERVNAHFAALACRADGMDGAGVMAGADRTDGAGKETANEGSTHSHSPHPSLLIVDELGRLELLRGEGLSEAMSLLKRGPSQAFPHALVVVREDLLIFAREMLEPAWGELVPLFPDEDSAERVCQAMNASEVQERDVHRFDS